MIAASEKLGECHALDFLRRVTGDMDLESIDHETSDETKRH